MNKEIRGQGEAFFETGTEGVLWAVYEDGKKGYDGLNVLDDGDHLIVYENHAKVWEGNVKLEYKRRYRPYPMNPSAGQQEVFGYWVHGFQEGLEPEVWARWFFEANRMLLHKRTSP